MQTKPRTTRERQDRSRAKSLLLNYLFLNDFRATDQKLCETVTVVGAIHRRLGRPAGSYGAEKRARSWNMCSRFVELVALGPELRSLAERRGEGVNEALFLVHEVLEEAFSDLHGLPDEGLREHLSSRLERRLNARVCDPAREPHMSPVLWKFALRRDAKQRAMAAPTG
jgi:hypothetical protein